MKHTCAQSCLTLCNPIDYSLPGSSVHGILQARRVEQFTISFSKGSSRCKDWTHVPWVSWIVDGGFLTTAISGKSSVVKGISFGRNCKNLHGFPGSSAGKESACNAGDTGLILVLERSPEEGIGYPLQYSWAFLVAQLVKNPPAMWETWVWSLGWEDPLEKGKATHSSILAWRIPWTVQFVGS